MGQGTMHACKVLSNSLDLVSHLGVTTDLGRTVLSVLGDYMSSSTQCCTAVRGVLLSSSLRCDLHVAQVDAAADILSCKAKQYV